MPRLSANLSMLFTELPLRQRFAAAAAAGFDAVELHYPYELTPSELADLLRVNALRLVLFNTSRGTPDDHGMACGPDHGARFLESVELAARYASATGCPAAHVLLGRVEPGQDRRAAYRLAVARLAQAADLLGAVGVRATVEALNARDLPGYLVGTTREAIRLIGDAGAPNLYLQFDVYHAKMAGEDILGSVDAAGGTLGHVQIADVPGRHEPGTGRIDFDLLLTHLDASGYRHWVGCEYRPLGGTAEGLKWASPWLRSSGPREEGDR